MKTGLRKCDKQGFLCPGAYLENYNNFYSFDGFTLSYD